MNGGGEDLRSAAEAEEESKRRRRRERALLYWDAMVKDCGDPAYHCMCSMQVVDITLMKHRLTSITSIRVVQQKHRRSTVCL
jgi:hypothetical protein